MKDLDYRKYPVLFVDDEEENLEIFSIHFRDRFTLFTATSGQEGLDLVERETVSVVLSDQRMAGMTGMEFLQEVRKRRPEVVTILVTAYSDLDVLAEGVSAGLLYAYVLKPWEVKDLEIVLRRGIEHFYLVSERDRLHREQIQTLRKMARANRLSAAGTLAAGIAHEIRNPLVSIQTFLEMVPEKLRELPLSDPKGLDRQFWESFRTLSLNEIRRIRNLISELVNLSRPSPPHFVAGEIGPVMQAMADLTGKEAAKKGVEVQTDLEPGLPKVRIDVSRVKQVLLNLIFNAIHALDSGGRLELIARSAKPPGTVRVVVRDNGPGISEEIQEALFDPFFTTKDPGEGVGLGLTICHQIMEEHGGEIEIRSGPGRGTEAVLTFPPLEQGGDTS